MKIFSITMSEACNLNCTYCNVDKKSKKSVDDNKVIDSIIEFVKNNNEKTQIDFFGGEPLLQFEKIKNIIINTKHLDIKYFMPTNGLLLDDNKLKFLNDNNVRISLSYDGLWQENRKQGNKNISKVYLERRDFFNKIPNFKIHTMIYPGNYNLLENHLFLLNYGANPELTLVKDVGVWNTESVNLLNNGISELFDWYIENIETQEIPNFIKHYLMPVVIYKSKKFEVQSCGTGSTYFSFSENKLISCNRFKDEPEFEKLIPNFLNMNKCSTCEIKSYCKKGCMYENIKNDGPINEVCDIFKHIFKCIFDMINKLKNNDKFKQLLVNMIKDEYGIN